MYEINAKFTSSDTGWDRKNSEATTGKVYAVFGDKNENFCAADNDTKSNNEGLVIITCCEKFYTMQNLFVKNSY